MSPFRAVAGAVLILALAACGTSTKAPSPRAVVLAAEDTLKAANQTALLYLDMPRCATAGTPLLAPSPLCSDPAVVTSVKALSQKAYNALVTAQTFVDADPAGAKADTLSYVSQATAAIADFVSLSNTLRHAQVK